MSPLAVHALFPGSFDPLTRGHVDLIRRASRLFARLTLGVAAHPDKPGNFSVEQRLALARACLTDAPGSEGANEPAIEFVLVPGLVVDTCRAIGATVLVRGVRAGSDLDYELPMARTNASLLPGLETVLLAPAPEFAHISSTLVRQIAALGGDVSAFVLPPVARALAEQRASRSNSTKPT